MPAGQLCSTCTALLFIFYEFLSPKSSSCQATFSLRYSGSIYLKCGWGKMNFFFSFFMYDKQKGG